MRRSVLHLALAASTLAVAADGSVTPLLRGIGETKAEPEPARAAKSPERRAEQREARKARRRERKRTGFR